MAKLLSFFGIKKQTTENLPDVPVNNVFTPLEAQTYGANFRRFVVALFAFTAAFMLWQYLPTFLLFGLILAGLYHLHKLFYPDIMEAAAKRNNIHYVTIRTHAKEIVFTKHANTYTVLLATINYNGTPEKTLTYRQSDNTHVWDYQTTAERLTEAGRQVVDFSMYPLTKQQAVRLHRFLITTNEPIFNAHTLLKFILIARSKNADGWFVRLSELITITLPFTLASYKNTPPTLPIGAELGQNAPDLHNGIKENLNALPLMFCLHSFGLGIIFTILFILFFVARGYMTEKERERKRQDKDRFFVLMREMLEADKTGSTAKADRINSKLLDNDLWR